ncbi:Nuclear hormone receptor [Aphelenchoides avenae]|nr:Nuclear hormone receptor [Aphelenchus avenae]
MKRYGATACLACVVFFRRNVQFLSGNLRCNCGSEGYATCRYCRLQKCVKAGMRPEAIQKRDRIGPRKRPAAEEQCPPDPGYSTSADSSRAETAPLIEPLGSGNASDGFIGYFHRLQMVQRASIHTFFTRTFPPFTVRAHEEDIKGLMTSGIIQSSVWLDHFPVFKDLDKSVKKEIIRDLSILFMCLECAALSIKQPDPNLNLIPNGTYLHLDYRRGLNEEELRKPDIDIKAAQHHDFYVELMQLTINPLRAIQADDYEFAALKCLLLIKKRWFTEVRFFNEDQQRQVLEMRTKCLQDLMQYCRFRHPEDAEVRFGNILLAIGGYICAISTVGKRQQLSRIFGYMTFTSTINDILFS